MGLIRNSSIHVHGGGPRSGGKKEMEVTNTAKRPAQERTCSTNVAFGEDDVKDASALNSTFGDDDTKDSSALNSTFGDDDTKDSRALNSTFGEYNAKDASALNSTWSTSTSAMEAIDDIEEDSYSQKSESSLQVLYRVIASGLFGCPVDTANHKYLSPKEEVIGTSMNDVSHITDVSYLSDLTLTFASDKAKNTGATALCCGVFSEWSWSSE